MLGLDGRVPELAGFSLRAANHLAGLLGESLGEHTTSIALASYRPTPNSIIGLLPATSGSRGGASHDHISRERSCEAPSTSTMPLAT